MKMTTVYKNCACANAMLGILPTFYLILLESHSFPASERQQEGRGGRMWGGGWLL